MKTLKDYITESRTRVLITLNKDADMNKEYSITTDSADEKFMKGNKNNVFEIKYKLTNKTKANYDFVTGIEVTSVRLCDEAPNDNPKHLHEDDLKEFNTIHIEDNTSCYCIVVGYGSGSHIDTTKHYIKMGKDKLYRNSLGDAFDVKA
jgi:hypothetical protein